MKNNIITKIIIGGLLFNGIYLHAQKTILEVDIAKTVTKIQPTMFGLFFEDINFAADGGLYAEMIKNRSFEFEKPTAINRILLQEYIALGQRVKAFNVEAKVDGSWKTVANETTIGYKRILRIDRVKASALRINITDSKANIVISNIQAYNAPTFVKEPQISRDKNGLVTIKSEEGNAVYYTLDGKTPSEKSTLYKGVFKYDKAVTIKAVAIDAAENISSAVKTAKYGVSKENWKIVSASSGDLKSADCVIDGNPNTDWSFGNDQ